MATFGRARRAPGSGNAFLRPFAGLLVVSLALLLLRDTTFVRAGATFVTELLVPAERVLGQVGSTAGGFWQAIAETENLRTDNGTLKAKVDHLTLENVQLREQSFQTLQSAQLAEAAKALKLRTQSAPVIARDPSGLLHTIVLGAGAKDGVLLDDVVISDQGVVGRVSEVGNNYSKVLLVTDSSSAVSALVQGSRAAGIVRGQFGDTLVMDWILQTEDVKIGDVVITAGLAIGNDLKSTYPKTLIATYVASPPGSVAAGAAFVVSVALSNTGTDTWKSTAPGLVNLSYHWYDPSGAPVVWDGARTPLGGDIAPTQQRVVQLAVSAPATPGAFLLRIALVQEGVGWLAPSNPYAITLQPPYVARFGAVTLPSFIAGGTYQVSVPVTNAGAAQWP